MTNNEKPSDAKTIIEKFHEGTLTEQDIEAFQAILVDSANHEIDPETLEEMEAFAKKLFEPTPIGEVKGLADIGIDWEPD